jgi:hypothetical protein
MIKFSYSDGAGGKQDEDALRILLLARLNLETAKPQINLLIIVTRRERIRQ